MIIMGQTREEKERSKVEERDLVDRMRRQVKVDDRELATTFGMKPDQTVIQSCLACNNENKNHTEVCCYGLFKDVKGGLQWRCTSAKPDSVSISRSTRNYILDNQGNKSFKRGSGSNDEICLSLGNQLNEKWSGNARAFNFLTQNENSCKEATKICKA